MGGLSNANSLQHAIRRQKILDTLLKKFKSYNSIRPHLDPGSRGGSRVAENRSNATTVLIKISNICKLNPRNRLRVLDNLKHADGKSGSAPPSSACFRHLLHICVSCVICAICVICVFWTIPIFHTFGNKCQF